MKDRYEKREGSRRTGGHGFGSTGVASPRAEKAPQESSEQKAVAARTTALRAFATHVHDTAMPAAKDAIIATRTPDRTTGWLDRFIARHDAAHAWLQHSWDVYFAINVLEGFPVPLDEADPDVLRRAHVIVAAAACDTALLSPALMALWARALGAARYEGQGSDPVLGSVFVFMVPSEGSPGDWRRVVICGTACDGCGCPGHAAHGHCFHCDSAWALARAMGLIPPPVNTTVFVADGQEFSTREEAVIHLAQSGKHGTAVDEVPVADLPDAGDYDRMEAEEESAIATPALACVGPRNRPRKLVKRRAPRREQSVPVISAAYQARIDDPARAQVRYDEVYADA